MKYKVLCIILIFMVALRANLLSSLNVQLKFDKDLTDCRGEIKNNATFVNNGTYSLEEGKINKAINMNNLDGLSLDASPMNTFTISFWFKIANNEQDNAYIFSVDNPLTTGSGGFKNYLNIYLDKQTNGKFHIITKIRDCIDVNTEISLEVTDNLSRGQWYHYTICVDRFANEDSKSEVKIYLNNELKISSSDTSDLLGYIDFNPSRPLLIGCDSSRSNNFRGKIDDFRIYGDDISKGIDIGRVEKFSVSEIAEEEYTELIYGLDKYDFKCERLINNLEVDGNTFWDKKITYYDNQEDASYRLKISDSTYIFSFVMCNNDIWAVAKDKSSNSTNARIAVKITDFSYTCVTSSALDTTNGHFYFHTREEYDVKDNYMSYYFNDEVSSIFVVNIKELLCDAVSDSITNKYNYLKKICDLEYQTNLHAKPGIGPTILGRTSGLGAVFDNKNKILYLLLQIKKRVSLMIQIQMLKIICYIK